MNIEGGIIMGMTDEIIAKLKSIGYKKAGIHKDYIIVVDNGDKLRGLDSGNLTIFNKETGDELYFFGIEYPGKDIQSKGIYNYKRKKFINNVDLEFLYNLVMAWNWA